MDYCDLHAGVRRQGEMATQRRSWDDDMASDGPHIHHEREFNPEAVAASHANEIFIGHRAYNLNTLQFGEVFDNPPTEAECSSLHAHGLQITEYKVWKAVRGEKFRPCDYAAVVGQNLCGREWLERLWLRQPTEEEAELLAKKVGLTFEQATRWYIAAPGLGPNLWIR